MDEGKDKKKKKDKKEKKKSKKTKEDKDDKEAKPDKKDKKKKKSKKSSKSKAEKSGEQELSEDDPVESDQEQAEPPEISTWPQGGRGEGGGVMPIHRHNQQ